MTDWPKFMDNINEYANVLHFITNTIGITAKENQDVKVLPDNKGELYINILTKDKYSNFRFRNKETNETKIGLPFDIPDWFADGEKKRLLSDKLQYDKQLNQLSKRLGASESVIRRIRTDFRTMAAEIDRIGINTSNIASTADMLNQRLGTAFRPDTGRFKELIGDVAVLTELMGLSEEAANGFFRAAASSSQSVEDIKLESLGIITAVEQQSGVLLDNVAILESAGKVSGQIRAQLHDSIQEIVEAESAARKFGMTLQSVADAGNQLLNFEQSISNELELKK